MNIFHDKHPRSAIAINVTRHPYSFLGDDRSSSGFFPSGQTWHESLIDYTGGTVAGALAAEKGIAYLGSKAGISFRFDQLTHWQPLFSQRMLLYAARLGKAELFMDRLNYQHFELGKSASSLESVLEACGHESVSIDVDAAEEFLQTKELEEEVWKSYGDTIHKYKVHSIPLFVLKVPSINAMGGPFPSDDGDNLDKEEGVSTPCSTSEVKLPPWIMNGSFSPDEFLDIFEDIQKKCLEAHD